MKEETILPEQTLPRQSPNWLIVFQTIPSILLLVCTVFGIFIGIRFLSFIERTEFHRISLSDKWSESGFEQLQQMHSIIQKEFDLIVEQRRENQALQAKIQEQRRKNQALQDKVQKILSPPASNTPTPVEGSTETPAVVPEK